MRIFKKMVANRENTIKTERLIEPCMDKTIKQLKEYLNKLRSGEVHGLHGVSNGSNKNKSMNHMINQEIIAIEQCIESLENAKRAVSNCELYSKIMLHEHEMTK